jgi:hypothetical protein
MTIRDGVGPKEIAILLSATDALGIHREAVRVPLDATPGGKVAIEGGKLVVVAPTEGPLETFAATIAARAQASPGFASLKRADA